MTDQRAILWIGDLVFPVAFLNLHDSKVTIHTGRVFGTNLGYRARLEDLSGTKQIAHLQTTIDGAQHIPLQLDHIQVSVDYSADEPLYELRCDGHRIDVEVEIRE